MKIRQQLLMLLSLSSVIFQVSAADLYVSLAGGANKNAGTKEAPFKNL